MSVNQFNPKQTTTLDNPKKVLQAQANEIPVTEISGQAPRPNAKIGFVSLGCPKNLVDSERILTQLRTEGYDVVPTYNDADLVIVNTCGFIDSAVEESLGQEYCREHWYRPYPLGNPWGPKRHKRTPPLFKLRGFGYYP